MACGCREEKIGHIDHCLIKVVDGELGAAKLPVDDVER